MRLVHITSIEARAERLNQPEVVDEYILRAERWEDSWLHLTDGDHAELNALWRETGASAKRGEANTIRKPCKEEKEDVSWDLLVSEVLSGDNNTWKDELSALTFFFERNLTPCQIRARKKRFSERYTAWKALQTAQSELHY